MKIKTVVITAAAAAAVAAVCLTGLLKNRRSIRVMTDSMYPAFRAGQLVKGIRPEAYDGSITRGTVVVFMDPDGSGTYMLKRVIGLPGEYVEFAVSEGERTEHVEIDGVPIEEPWLTEPMQPSDNGLALRVPENAYLCLGDNRNHSEDSRTWERKFIWEDEIEYIIP